MNMSGKRTIRDTPCKGICSTTNVGDPVCIGCGRTRDEVTAWNRMKPDQKVSINKRLQIAEWVRQVCKDITPALDITREGFYYNIFTFKGQEANKSKLIDRLIFLQTNRELKPTHLEYTSAPYIVNRSDIYDQAVHSIVIKTTRHSASFVLNRITGNLEIIFNFTISEAKNESA